MLSELFSALIPKVEAEEQAAEPAKEENSGADAEGEAKEEEEPEPEEVRRSLFSFNSKLLTLEIHSVTLRNCFDPTWLLFAK